MIRCSVDFFVLSLVKVAGRGEKIHELFCPFGEQFFRTSALADRWSALFQNVKKILYFCILYSRVLLPETSLDIVSPGIGGASSVFKAPEMWNEALKSSWFLDEPLCCYDVIWFSTWPNSDPAKNKVASCRSVVLKKAIVYQQLFAKFQDLQNVMDGGKKVWVPDNEHGFRLGEIVDLGSDTITVEVDGSKGKVWLTDMSLISLAKDFFPVYKNVDR